MVHLALPLHLIPKTCKITKLKWCCAVHAWVQLPTLTCVPSSFIHILTQLPACTFNLYIFITLSSTLLYLALLFHTIIYICFHFSFKWCYITLATTKIVFYIYHLIYISRFSYHGCCLSARRNLALRRGSSRRPRPLGLLCLQGLCHLPRLHP